MAQELIREYSAAEIRACTGQLSDLAMVGQGGFGRVYRAMLNLTPVAIKVLDNDGMQGMKEFQTEMRLLPRIRHPSIVKLLGWCSSGNLKCLVYELMTHGNLEERLAACKEPSCRPLLWPARFRIAAAVAAALCYLHALNITHRDIKAENILLDANDDARLADIGLAVRSSGPSNPGPNSAQAAVGTWSYLAPEVRAGGATTAKADVYAFGLCLLQLATGATEPKGLVAACQQCLEAAQLQQLLDASAGTWDLRFGERLVKLGLWCCMHNAQQRPSMLLIAEELQRLLTRLQPDAALE